MISLSGRKWLYYALLGLLNPVGYYLVLFKAYDLLPAQIAQPVNYIWPIMLLILLALFTHHPIPSSKYIGMFISLLGVTLISWGTGYSGKETISYYGLLLALLSALLWAIYWMIQNKQKEKQTVVSLFCQLLIWYGLSTRCVLWNGSNGIYHRRYSLGNIYRRFRDGYSFYLLRHCYAPGIQSGTHQSVVLPCSVLISFLYIGHSERANHINDLRRTHIDCIRYYFQPILDTLRQGNQK